MEFKFKHREWQLKVMRDSIPLARLSNQVSASAADYGDLYGPRLWVFHGMHRSFAVGDRDHAEEVVALRSTPLQFNILTLLKRARQSMTMGALAAMLVDQYNTLSRNFSALSDKELVLPKPANSDRRSLLDLLTSAGMADESGLLVDLEVKG